LLSALFIAAAAVLLWVTIGKVTATESELNRVKTKLAELKSLGPRQLSASFDRDAQLVVTSDAFGASVWDWRAVRLITPLPVTKVQFANTAAFSPDGTRIVAAGADGVARIWAWRNPELSAQLRHPAEVTSAAFSPDGTQIVTASKDGLARLWDWKAGRVLVTLRRAGRVASFSSDGARVLAVAKIGEVRVWSLKHEEVAPVVLPAKATNAAFNPDGTLVVTAGTDGIARVWDLKKGTIVKSLTGHSAQVTSAAFSPNGKLIVTSGWDGVARLWEWKTGRSVVLEHPAQVMSAAFSQDGKFIVTACLDGKARIYGPEDALR